MALDSARSCEKDALYSEKRINDIKTEKVKQVVICFFIIATFHSLLYSWLLPMYAIFVP
jgi:hypothetical protein